MLLLSHWTNIKGSVIHYRLLALRVRVLSSAEQRAAYATAEAHQVRAPVFANEGHKAIHTSWEALRRPLSTHQVATPGDLVVNQLLLGCPGKLNRIDTGQVRPDCLGSKNSGPDKIRIYFPGRTKLKKILL